MSTSDRESILQEIGDTERQIAGLRQQQEEDEATLRSLRERYSLHDHENPHQPKTPATVTVSTAKTRE